ncbi:MAG: glycoside hydrolase family 43 [Ruminococcus sp.]|nr:glycoside hydrolase family 43 [Ruminococcus sp.]
MFKRRIFAAAASAVFAMAAITANTDTTRYELTADAATTSSTIANPFIWADVPDEDVIRVGDTYYMVSTTMFYTPGAPIMKSKDLVSWEICSYVYDIMADGDVQNLTNGKHDYAHGQWATSLRYHDGNFYVFFGSYGTNKSYIYKTNDIENGKWTRSEINGMYHDASMLFDDDGRNYLVYGGGGEIKIKELNAEMTGFKSGGAEKTLFKTGLDGLSGEGAHIQKINGYYYVFIIAWPSGSGRIELCYRSKDLLGTYEGKTVLNSGVGTYGSGVAQGGIVDTPDGKWYAMLFQDHGSVGRIPVLVPVTWQNDWPMMGVNGKAPVTFTVEGDYKGTHLAKDDDFSYSENKLALEWQWNHNPDNKSWSVTEREGYLRLKNNTLATNIINARNTLTQRTEGPACSSVIKLDTKGMKVGDYAGLSAFQFKYGNVGVYVADDGSKRIFMSENGGYQGATNIMNSSNKIIEQVNLSGNEIYLKVDFKFNNVDGNLNVSNNIDKANFYYSYDGNNWTKIGNELSMVYDLKMFTGYRSGIFSYGTKNLGGYADIDFFDYERADWNLPTVIEPDENGNYFCSTFESSTDSWKSRGPATVTVSSDEAFESSKSLFVSERESSWNGATKQLSTGVFKPGEAYSFSADVFNYDSDEPVNFFIKLEYTDSAGEAIYDTIAQSKGKKGTWMHLENLSYTIPSDATNMSVYIETEEGTASFFADNICGGLKREVDYDFIYGDVNGDAVIDVFDITAARAIMNNGSNDTVAKLAADINKSGAVDEEDVLKIKEYITVKTNELVK